MSQEEKIEFIKKLTDSFQKSLLEKLPRVPENWDGFELRQWIVDSAADQMLCGSGLEGKRKREYKNDVIVNNL